LRLESAHDGLAGFFVKQAYFDFLEDGKDDNRRFVGLRSGIRPVRAINFGTDECGLGSTFLSHLGLERGVGKHFFSMASF